MTTMKNHTLLCFVFLAIFSVACQSDQQPKEDPVETNLPLTFKDTVFNKSYGTCSDSVLTGNCVSIKFNYPLANGAAVKKMINEAVAEELKNTLAFEVNETTKLMSLDQMADSIIAEYQVLKGDMEDSSMEFHYEVNGSVKMQNEKLVSIELPAYTYTGGAHPNSFTSLINIDLAKQKVLERDDIIADTTSLKKIGEVAFFKAREGDDVAKDMFFWDAGYFLPANMALTEKGLYFYYNPYEAAPYVLGPTAYTIPYDQLDGILKSDYLAK